MSDYDFYGTSPYGACGKTMSQANRDYYDRANERLDRMNREHKRQDDLEDWNSYESDSTYRERVREERKEEYPYD